MTYRQITSVERYSLGLLRRQRLCPAAIARILGRHRSSILRELRCTRARSDGTYRPPLADWYARGRLDAAAQSAPSQPPGVVQMKSSTKTTPAT